MAGNPLIGTGYESFGSGSDFKNCGHSMVGHSRGINEAHNGYLELYLNLGWIGVALLVGLIVTGYRKVIATFRDDPGQGSLGVAFFVAALAYNFTEAGFRMMSPLWILFLLAIIGVPKAAVSESPVMLMVDPGLTDSPRRNPETDTRSTMGSAREVAEAARRETNAPKRYLVRSLSLSMWSHLCATGH